jgi:transcriptional regulator with XRE-family HTH domain
MNLPNLIHQQRKATGLTRHQLSQRSGVDKLVIVALETEGELPHRNALVALLGALGIPPETYADALPAGEAEE